MAPPVTFARTGGAIPMPVQRLATGGKVKTPVKKAAPKKAAPKSGNAPGPSNEMITLGSAANANSVDYYDWLDENTKRRTPAAIAASTKALPVTASSASMTGAM